MSEATNLKYVAKPETISSLAVLYNMDRRTLKKNIKPIMSQLSFKKERRHLLNIKEVLIIIEHLGEPEIA